MKQVTMNGRLGKDAELRERDNGSTYLSFSLAEDYRRANGEKETTWYNCTLNVFGDGGENIAQWLRKGVQIIVVGRDTSRITKDGDIIHYFNVEKFEFIGGLKQDDKQSNREKGKQAMRNSKGVKALKKAGFTEEEDDDDEPPF